MEFTDQDYELLSAYLDGDLDATERAQLESRLSAEPELRQELAALRQTVQLVRQLPALRAPRDFRLTPKMVEQIRRDDQPLLTVLPSAKSAPTPRRTTLNFMLPVLSAAASLLLVLFGFGMLLMQNGALSPMSAGSVQTANQMKDAAPGSIASLSTPALTSTSVNYFSKTGEITIEPPSSTGLTDQITEKQLTMTASTTEQENQIKATGVSMETMDLMIAPTDEIGADDASVVPGAPITLESAADQANMAVPPSTMNSLPTMTLMGTMTGSITPEITELTYQSAPVEELPSMEYSGTAAPIPSVGAGGEGQDTDSTGGSAAGSALSTMPQGTSSPDSESVPDAGAVARNAAPTEAGFLQTTTATLLPSDTATPTETMTLAPKNERDVDGMIASQPDSSIPTETVAIILIGAGVLLAVATGFWIARQGRAGRRPSN